MKKSKILVCGDRNWASMDVIRQVLGDIAYPSDTIIHGDCRGADRIAGAVAREIGANVEAHPANWQKYGKAAGPIRNQQMLDRKPDIVLAFHDDIAHSKGTKDMIKRAKRAGIEVELYDLRGIEIKIVMDGKEMYAMIKL